MNYLFHAVDSIKKNLNRMIFFEKELKQRNYFLSEKTKSVDALVALIESMQQSLEVVDIPRNKVKKIFGKPSVVSSTQLIYRVETYESNCPFIEITFSLQGNSVSKIQYRVMDCEKMK
ncbi:MAG: hypothetical protein ACHQK8_05725 [Bacteroidia bacterium]